MPDRKPVDYKDRTYRTLFRDVKALIGMNLIAFDKEANAWRAKK